MISQLSQEAMTEYASNAQTIQEPTGADYSRGVAVGRTIPAKWWNWLFRASTKRIEQSRNDAQSMLSELQNVVTDAGLTPSAADSTQLAQAVEAKTDVQINTYITNKQNFYSMWDVIDTQGLLPQNTSSDSTYRLAYLDKINGVYFAINRTYKLSSGNYTQVQNALAFSTDLRNWHLIRGTTFGRSGVDQAQQFGAGVTYFKGYWYVLLVGSGMSSGSTLSFVLAKLADLNDLGSYTVVRTSSETLQNYSNFQIGTLGGNVLFVKESLSNSIDISTDGSTFTSVALNAVSYSSYGQYYGWLAVESIKLGASYAVGDFIASADGATWRCYNTLVSRQSIIHSLVRFKGGVVTRGTVYFLAGENDNAVLLGGEEYTFSRITYDGMCLFLSRNSVHYFTLDGVTVLPLDTGISHDSGTRIDSINGIYYAAFSSDKQIYSSPDLQSWTPTGKYLPSGASALAVVSEAGVFVSSTKCSRDLGEIWVQSKDSTGQNYCPTDLSIVDDTQLYVLTDFIYTPVAKLKLIYHTARGFNFVSGHTLYLQ